MLLWEPSHMGAADQCMCRTRKCKKAVTYFFGLLTMMMRSTGGWRMCFDFLTVLLSPLMSTFRSRKVWLCCCWWSLLWPPLQCSGTGSAGDFNPKSRRVEAAAVAAAVGEHGAGAPDELFAQKNDDGDELLLCHDDVGRRAHHHHRRLEATHRLQLSDLSWRWTFERATLHQKRAIFFIWFTIFNQFLKKKK